MIWMTHQCHQPLSMVPVGDVHRRSTYIMDGRTELISFNIMLSVILLTYRVKLIPHHSLASAAQGTQGPHLLFSMD